MPTVLARMCLVVSLVGCGSAPLPSAPTSPPATIVVADSDGDGFSNECDPCPEERESLLDRADADGCPGGRRIVLEEIVSITPLRFPEDRAVWLPEHDVFADDIARFIAEHPTLRGLRIIGHASPAERRAEWLARERANLVRDQLELRGVPDQALFVVSGVGATPTELEDVGVEAFERVTFEVIWFPRAPPLPAHCR